MPNCVNVRWLDGYLETFEATDVRFGCDLLWLRLVDGANRHIPLRAVRWFSLSQESHGVTFADLQAAQGTTGLVDPADLAIDGLSDAERKAFIDKSDGVE